MSAADDLAERMRPLRARFLQRAAEDRAALAAAWDASDLAQLQAVAHRLAGNAGLFGFPDLSAAARRAEEAILDNAPPVEAEARLIDLLQLLDRLGPET